MQKNVIQWLWGLSACTIGCLLSLCLWPSVIYTELFSVVCLYIVFDGIAFFVGYSFFKKLSTLTFWKFLVHLGIVIITGLTISFLWPTLPAHAIAFAFFVTAVFVFLNIGFWKIAFHLTGPKASLIGIFMGLVNSIVCCMSIPMAH